MIKEGRKKVEGRKEGIEGGGKEGRDREGGKNGKEGRTGGKNGKEG